MSLGPPSAEVIGWQGASHVRSTCPTRMLAFRLHRGVGACSGIAAENSLGAQDIGQLLAARSQECGAVRLLENLCPREKNM
jgi:hypothetical protein